MGKLVGAGGLLFLSLFMLLGFFSSDLTGSAAEKTLALLIAVVLPGGGGAALIYSHFKQKGILHVRKQRLRQQTLEAEILKLADRGGGKLTVVEVVSETAVDPETAKRALDSLHARDIADIEVTESGVIVYAFFDIEHLSEKSSAKGVLHD